MFRPGRFELESLGGKQSNTTRRLFTFFLSQGPTPSPPPSQHCFYQGRWSYEAGPGSLKTRTPEAGDGSLAHPVPSPKETTLHFFQTQSNIRKRLDACNAFYHFLRPSGPELQPTDLPGEGQPRLSPGELREVPGDLGVREREWGLAHWFCTPADQSRKQRHSLTPKELLHLSGQASGEPQPNKKKLSLSRRRTGSHGSAACRFPAAQALSRTGGWDRDNLGAGWRAMGGAPVAPQPGRYPAHFRRAALPGEGAWPGSEVGLVQTARGDDDQPSGCSDHGVQQVREPTPLGTDTLRRCAVPAALPGGRRSGRGGRGRGTKGQGDQAR